MKIRCSYNKMAPITELKVHPQNRNSHPDTQVEQLAKILEYQGWRNPIKVSNQSGFITSGHGRLLAAQKNNWTEVPVDFQDYDSPEQEYADIQADNAIAIQAELDFSAINLDIKELKLDQGFDLSLLGLQSVFLDLPTNEKTDAGAEWTGMPEFRQGDKTSVRHVVVHFETEDDARKFFTLIGQNDTGKTKTVWFPPQERMDTESKRYE